MTTDEKTKIVEIPESIAEARAQLTALVERMDRKDYVYPRAQSGLQCVNVEAGEDGAITGSCLIGTYLLELEEGLGSFMIDNGYDQWGISGLTSVLHPDEGWAYAIKVSSPVLGYLIAAQNAQDTGATWGEAVGALPFEWDAAEEQFVDATGHPQ